jgi:hypothetical protein
MLLIGEGEQLGVSYKGPLQGCLLFQYNLLKSRYHIIAKSHPLFT